MMFNEVKRYWKQSILSKILLGVFVAGLVFYGATKNGKIEFLLTDMDINYFVDRGSTVSNDCIVLNFETVVVPLDAPIYILAREVAYTNDEEWVQIAQGTIGLFKNITIEYQNATNYNFRVYTDWTPGPTVHTNGVLNMAYSLEYGGQTEDKIGIIPLNTEVEMKNEFSVGIFNGTILEFTQPRKEFLFLINLIPGSSSVKFYDEFYKQPNHITSSGGLYIVNFNQPTKRLYISDDITRLVECLNVHFEVIQQSENLINISGF